MSWKGVKQQINTEDIKAWCEEMRIRNYTINDKGEIDVDRGVYLGQNTFKELPYKFGKVNGLFSLAWCENLTSLKNCPYFVGDTFSMENCSQLDSLEGCPKKVKGNFWCGNCKRDFTKEEIKSICKVKKYIFLI